MALRLNDDFCRKLKNGEEFSGQKEGFIFLEYFDLASKKDTVSPFQLWNHLEFIQTMLDLQGQNQCLWFVENTSKKTLNVLEKSFPVNAVLNGSISGYFSIDHKLISKFWNLCREANEQEPWHNEQAWGLAGVTSQLSQPQAHSLLQKPYWSIEHILQNSDKLCSIFVQMGWFGFLGLRKSPFAAELIAKEFPGVHEVANNKHQRGQIT
jgi:hypothetical protein